MLQISRTCCERPAPVFGKPVVWFRGTILFFPTNVPACATSLLPNPKEN